MMLQFHRWNSFPGPKAISSLPLLGHSYMLGSAPIPVLKELLKKYGDVVRFDLGPTPTVLIGSYDMLMDLFKREVRKFFFSFSTLFFLPWCISIMDSIAGL